MSTVQSYQYSAEEEMKQWADMERSRRQLELERLQANRIQAELNRLVEAKRIEEAQHRKDAQRREETQQREDAQRKDETQRHTEQYKILSEQILIQQQELATCRSKMHETSQSLDCQMASLKEVANDVCKEKMDLMQSMKVAQETLDQIEQITLLNLRDNEELAQCVLMTSELAGKQEDLFTEIQQLEREIRFISLDADLVPAAMATLLSMKDNGYQLGEFDSTETLTGYFKKAESEHQIAVRMAPIKKNFLSWDLIVETFDMLGEVCLTELDDFEMAVEDLDLGNLVRTTSRVYPKDERGENPERQGILPSPRKVAAKKSRRTGTRKLKT